MDLILINFKGFKKTSLVKNTEVADRIAKESLSFLNYDLKLYSIVPNWLRSHVETDKCM